MEHSGDPIQSIYATQRRPGTGLTLKQNVTSLAAITICHLLLKWYSTTKPMKFAEFFHCVI